MREKLTKAKKIHLIIVEFNIKHTKYAAFSLISVRNLVWNNTIKNYSKITDKNPKFNTEKARHNYWQNVFHSINSPFFQIQKFLEISFGSFKYFFFTGLDLKTSYSDSFFISPQKNTLKTNNFVQKTRQNPPFPPFYVSQLFLNIFKI